MSRINKLLTGRVLALNSLWNFAGMAAPMVVGLFAIPYLIEGMGKERFGLLAIIWMGVGYFSLFDMGLGRALTKLIAERLGRDESHDLPEIIWTALCLILWLGLIGMIIVLLSAEPLTVYLLNVPAALENEGVASFHLLAVSIPLVIATSALIGILQAHQRFSLIAVIRVPLGIATFLGPVISLQYSPSLSAATLILVLARIVAFILYYAMALRVNPALKRPRGVTRAHIRPLLTFGGWLTITNIIGPILTYLDRFFVGAITNMVAVTYYATPYDVLSRLQILPQSIMGVIFPALAMANSEPAYLKKLYKLISQILFLLVLPIMGGIFLFASELLHLWLGEEFSTAATPVVRWLALGWMANALARPASTVLQSIGRPDLVAKTHAAELIPYLTALWIMTQGFGIAGTAVTWFARLLIDNIILNELVRRTLPDFRTVVLNAHLKTGWIIGGFIIVWIIDSVLLRSSIFISVIMISTVFLWRAFASLQYISKRESDTMSSMESVR